MKIFSLLEIQYSKLVSAIKEYLSNTLSNLGVSLGNNTVFGQLINVINSVVQNVMLYIEDSLVEQNKYTAQRKKSIYGLAAQAGYEPFLGKATGVQLSISYIPNNYSTLNVLINNKEPLTCTQNGLIYNIILPQETIIFSPDKDATTKYIYAVQGKFESQRFISSGGKYYTQNVRFVGNLDKDYIQVKVNNELWEYVDSIYDMTPEGKQWTYKVSISGGIDIVFGNSIHGKALQINDVIDITYLLHDGEQGNIDVDTETYFVFNNNLQDISGEEIDGNSIFNITFASKDPVSSGSNSESIQQVKEMIGYNTRSLVLSDPNSYKNFLKKFSFCGYNRTWSEPGSLIVNSLIMKNYNLLLGEGKDYFSLTEDDFKLSDNQKSSLIQCLENSGNQLAGITYNIFDPILSKYTAYVYIKMKNTNYDKEFISNCIKNTIGSYFADLESDIFISKSDIVYQIKSSISDIDSVDIYFLSEANETAMKQGYYDNTTYIFDQSTGIYKKKQEKVYLYSGENPNLGLDSHGNIYLVSNNEFPVLMGGWSFMNQEGDLVSVTDPLNIIFE